MKIARVETLLSQGDFAQSAFWEAIRRQVHDAIRSMDWPPGSGTFTIYPESGKKRGQGNGVVPIKLGLMQRLEAASWKLEERIDIASRKQPGKIDAVRYTEEWIIALEWETGNISSSHRALNKLALALMLGKLSAGMLVVPSRAFYRFLTDRIGNWEELEPYLPLWRAVACEEGVLEIIVVEHDAESTEVERIPKGTDGRALG